MMMENKRNYSELGLVYFVANKCCTISATGNLIECSVVCFIWNCTSHLKFFFPYMLLLSVELYNFEMKGEEEEDEDTIIERRRLQRLAILQKYQTSGTGSNAPSSVPSVLSQTPSDARSDSDDSDTVEKQATQDLEDEIAMANSQTDKAVKESKATEIPAKNNQEVNNQANLKGQKVVGDMFADDDMFSENYSVSLMWKKIPQCKAHNHSR